ncbi:MAG: hypothetical protein PHI98_14960 [Eubacteriales bacterium]|nr:hypothetical protein [Eubacteriales bacterium]
MKNSIELSLPQSKTVCGYEIKKMPVGVFLKAVQALNDIPMELSKALFPGEGVDGMLAQLKGIDKNGMQELLLRALTVLPEKVIALFAQLSGIGENELLGDATIGLDGLAEMMLCWAEVNGIENFMASARKLADKMRAQTTEKSGSKG